MLKPWQRRIRSKISLSVFLTQSYDYVVGKFDLKQKRFTSEALILRLFETRFLSHA